MTAPLLKTKLYPPQQNTTSVPRPRLSELLNTGLDRKLTLISAPAGFGKTTLLADWMSECQQPVAYLCLDESDNDPIRFLSYIIAALQTIAPSVGAQTLATIQSTQRPPMEGMLSSLLNEIMDRMPDFVLILDDYHAIDSQAVHQSLTYALEHLPHQMHVIIATRSDPPIALSRLRSRGQLVELRTSDLRFSLDETESYLNEIMDFGLPNQAVKTLYGRTEGWVVGLQLAALSMRATTNIDAFIAAFAGDDRYIADYLIEEVLNHQPDYIREFLLKTSILEPLNASLCEAITDRKDCFQILDRLEKNNLFIIALNHNREWYRYHHLFAELLQGWLRYQSPDQLPELHLRASLWYEQQAMPHEAVRHASAVNDHERVAYLIELHALNLTSQGEVATLERWLDQLPEVMVRTRPWLSLARAWAKLSAGHLEAIDQPLRDVESQLVQVASPDDQTVEPEVSGLAIENLYDNALEHKMSSNFNRILGHIATIRASAAAMTSNQADVFLYARRALEFLPDDDWMARSLSSMLLGIALRWKGDLAEAIDALNQAEVLSRASGDCYVAIFSGCIKGYILTFLGQLQPAMATYHELQAMVDAISHTDGTMPVAAGLVHSYKSGVLCEWNDLDAALHHAKLGLGLSLKWGHAYAISDGYYFLISAQIAQRDYAGALDTINQAKIGVGDLSPQFRLDITSLGARLNLLKGAPDKAHRWAQEARIRPKDELNFGLLQHYLVLSRVLIAIESHTEALMLLDRILQLAERANALGRVIETLVVQAVAFYANGDNPSALSSLERALTIAEPQGYIRTFIEFNGVMAELLRQAAVRGASVEYVGKLLSALQLEGPVGAEMILNADIDIRAVLSERELQVSRLMLAGLNSTEIAEELVIAKGTARTHLKSIYRKLGVHRRAQAVERVKKLGL